MENSLEKVHKMSGRPALVAEATAIKVNWLTARLTGPGGNYNIGNIIALFGCAAVQVAQSPSGQSSRDAVIAFLFGSPGASWLTISMIVFLVAGEAYHRALVAGCLETGRLIRLGDALSGVASVALMVALIHFGDTTMAVVAGTLLAGGKFGTALLPRSGGTGSTHWPRAEACFRWIVVLSRFPSLAALSLEILRAFFAAGPVQTMIMPALMTFCFLLWLRADLQLMSISERKGAQV